MPNAHIDLDIEAAFELLAQGEDLALVADALGWTPGRFERRLAALGFDQPTLEAEYHFRGDRLPPLLQAPRKRACRCCGRAVQQPQGRVKTICDTCSDINVAMVA